MQGRIAKYCTLFIGLLTFVGCSHPTHRCHWLYDYIPENRDEIAPHQGDKWLAWAILGNDDDGIFGEKNAHDEAPLTCGRALSYQLRNPLHNFCFYVIGTADKQNDELDLLKITQHGMCVCHYHEVGTTVFADKNTSFYLGLHGAKPFISLRLRYLPERQFDFYFGWRERGNFGIKFLPFSRVRD